MREVKTSWIYCKNSGVKGKIDFFIMSGSEKKYLFSQKYKKGMYNHYKGGLRYNVAVDYSKTHNDSAIKNVIKRIRSSVEYVVKHENFYVPEKAVVWFLEVNNYEYRLEKNYYKQ